MRLRVATHNEARGATPGFADYTKLLVESRFGGTDYTDFFDNTGLVATIQQSDDKL
jgi:hypothetical protein